MKIKPGDKVSIVDRQHMEHGGWGTVRSFDGDVYHVAMYQESSSAVPREDVMIFDRDQIKKSKLARADNPQKSNWIQMRSYKGSDGGRYEEYMLDGLPQNGIMTVEIDKKRGYRVRNIFVNEHVQRQGYATEAYMLANARSIEVSGKPLRSSEIGYGKKSSATSMSPDAVALWESFVGKGLAAIDGDHYVMISENPLAETDTQRDWMLNEKVNAVVSMNPRDFIALTVPSIMYGQKIMDEARPLKDYNEFIESGETQIPPMLKVDIKTGRVMGHEGRHRAAAILKNGEKEMNVALILVDDYTASRQRSILDAPPIWYGEFDPKRSFGVDRLLAVVRANVQFQYQREPQIEDIRIEKIPGRRS